MKSIWIIAKKELKRFFTDKRVLLGLILPGLLIFIIYNLMGTIMSNRENEEYTEFKVVLVNNPENQVISNILDVDGWKIDYLDLEKDEAIKKLENKEIDMYIKYDENFNIQAGQDTVPNVEIYYNSTKDESNYIYTYYIAKLNDFEATEANLFDINRGGISADTATNEDTMTKVLTMMLPFLLIVLLYSGCMSVCADSIAGEKERGTIATLLITPVRRSSIVVGKLIALTLAAVVSSISSFLGLVLSFPKLSGANLSFAGYGINEYILMLLVILTCDVFFVVLVTIISTLAKSIKEASSYAAVGTILVMAIGITSFMATKASSNYGLYFVPIYNTLQSLIGLFSHSAPAGGLVITLISNVVYTGLGVLLIAQLFKNEKIMFAK